METTEDSFLRLVSGFSLIVIAILVIIILHTEWHNLFIRPKYIKEIAKKYGLKYRRIQISFWFLFYPSSVRMNIMEGKVEGKDILIYDLLYIRGFPKSMNEKYPPLTLVSVDGVEKKMTSFYYGFSPVEEIESLLSNRV